VLPVAGHPQAGHHGLQLREAAVEGVGLHGGWGDDLHSPWGWGGVRRRPSSYKPGLSRRIASSMPKWEQKGISTTVWDDPLIN
jgi:hypothetical protein